MVKKYKSNFNSILDKIIDKEFLYLMENYKDNNDNREWVFLYRELKWEFIINTKKIRNEIKLDNTIWTKEKFYEHISILEDIIFNTFKNNDCIIDELINILFKYKIRYIKYYNG